MCIDAAKDGFKDVVATRENFGTDLYDTISKKIDGVYQKELEIINQEKDLLLPILGSLEVSDDEVAELADEIKNYYDEVNNAQLFAQCNPDLIAQVKANRTEISDALSCIRDIIDEKDTICAMVLMSRDPIKVLKPLKTLLIQINSDLSKVDAEMETRSKAIKDQTGRDLDDPYKPEKKIITSCEKELERLGEKCKLQN